MRSPCVPQPHGPCGCCRAVHSTRPAPRQLRPSSGMGLVASAANCAPLRLVCHGCIMAAQVDKMLPGVLEESDMGPGFSFREYSFLDNPMVPREVRWGFVLVEIYDEPGAMAHKRFRATEDWAAQRSLASPCCQRSVGCSVRILSNGVRQCSFLGCACSLAVLVPWLCSFPDSPMVPIGMSPALAWHPMPVFPTPCPFQCIQAGCQYCTVAKQY